MSAQFLGHRHTLLIGRPQITVVKKEKATRVGLWDKKLKQKNKEAVSYHVININSIWQPNS